MKLPLDAYPVERLARVVVPLQLRQRQPELHALGHLFHRSLQQQQRRVLLLQRDRRLPQRHRIRNELQRLPIYPPFFVNVVFEVRRRLPDAHGAWNVLHGVGENNLGILLVLKVARLQPHVFAAGTVLATFRDYLPCRGYVAFSSDTLHTPTRLFLQPRGSNPSPRVARVGIHHGFEGKSRLLDVAQLRLTHAAHAVQGGHVPAVKTVL